MHANGVLLQHLFSGLNQHDARAMADCYHPEASFRDIAFDLHGRRQIQAMWEMVCNGDIRATFDIVHADDETGQVNLIDDYTFSSTGRRVHNVIDSRFRFRDGLILRHEDSCDSQAWAAMALGGLSGFLAGRFHFLRSSKARKKLRDFVAQRPEYKDVHFSWD